MSKNNELNQEFDNAVARINEHKEPFPADILLRLYAFYKIATRDYGTPGSRTPLINAFKANALFQIKDMDIAEAKRNYVECVNNYFDAIEKKK